MAMQPMSREAFPFPVHLRPNSAQSTRLYSKHRIAVSLRAEQVRYFDRQNDIVLEAAQIDLRYGITTVRDSYGMLVPLTAVRDRINSGQAIGPRILAATWHADPR